MTKKYYEPLEFPELDKLKKIDTPVTPEPDPVLQADIADALREIELEFKLLKIGESKLRDGSIEVSVPVWQSWQTLVEMPTSRPVLRRFIKLVKQDLDHRILMHFAKLFEEADPELEGYINGLGV